MEKYGHGELIFVPTLLMCNFKNLT